MATVRFSKTIKSQISARFVSGATAYIIQNNNVVRYVSSDIFRKKGVSHNRRSDRFVGEPKSVALRVLSDFSGVARAGVVRKGVTRRSRRRRLGRAVISFLGNTRAHAFLYKRRIITAISGR